jgi:hypothetical protein
MGTNMGEELSSAKTEERMEVVRKKMVLRNILVDRC